MTTSIPKPLIDIPIPGPIFQLDIISITLIYIFGVYSDYYLLCKTPSSCYPKVKIFILIYHVVIPLVFEPIWRISIAMYLSISWFIAVIGIHAVKKARDNKMSFGMFMKGVGVEGLLNDMSTMTEYQIRMEGVQRLLTVLFIWLWARLIINPLLLDDPEMLLTMKWYTPTALYYGFIMGIKGYTVMKTNDMLLSLAQIIWGIRTIQYFDLPFLATSPKDFWGRRWNKVVRNVLHKQIFADQNSSRSPAIRGVLAFVISGLVHEVMMSIINRQITLEQFSFFCIQNVFVCLQIRFLPRKKMLPRVLCSALTLLLIDLSGQLFLGPYLRSTEQKAVFGRYSLF